MKRVLFSLTLLAFALLPTAVYAQSAPVLGSFAFTLSGYTVQGQLSNAIINPDNSVSLTMNLDDNLQTSMGAIPISGNGQWYGTVNGTNISGSIQNVAGSLQVCYFLFFCGYANYSGYGIWIGTLSGNQGSGTFQGYITFTSSSIPEITLNQAYPISGNWNSAFHSTD